MPEAQRAKRKRDNRVAILQSCYLPWKGYFDIIGSVDVFVVYDDVQYSKNHWHNRNLVKTQHGPKWLTVPVSKSSGSFQNIEDVRLPSPFLEKHWQIIEQSYARAQHFSTMAPQLKQLFEHAEQFRSLSELNLQFLRGIAGMLGFTTKFVLSRDLVGRGTRTERLVAICQELGADRYLSGPAAKAYLEEEQFAAAGIGVRWMDYSGYPAYPQLHGDFEHSLSIIDLILNTGYQARQYMKAPVELG